MAGKSQSPPRLATAARAGWCCPPVSGELPASLARAVRLACHGRRMANIQRTSRHQQASSAASTADSTRTDRTAHRPMDRIARAAAVLLVGALATACASSHGSDPSNRPSESSSASHPPPQQWQALEDFVRDLAANGAFSGAVLVTEDGQPLVQQAYGLADREANRPNNIETRFDIGSLGKMFTGVAIAQLVEQGKLDFDDRIGENLPGLPLDLAAVTIHQLLTHTSGMGDFARNGYPEEAKAAQTRGSQSGSDRDRAAPAGRDRKSTRLNSSHLGISYAVFCLKKKKRSSMRSYK